MENQYPRVISFDCYGTLIDWKNGVIRALAPLMDDYHLSIWEEDLFALFSEADRHFTSGKYITYREILTHTMKWIANKLGINLYGNETDTLISSVPNWEPFPDVLKALWYLKQKHPLVILSNIDDDLFSFTREKIGVVFDEVITSYQIRSYKPAPGHFREALERLDIKKSEMLHIAQSIYHDIDPCLEMGIPCIWINRYGETVPQTIENNKVPFFHSLTQ